MKNTNYNLYINKNINLLKNKNKIYNIMIKAGLIKKFVSGFYTIMPLGLIIINNIKNIIIKNMNNIDMYEISMPILQPNDLWKKSNRFNIYNKEFIFTEIYNKKYILSPTNEEQFMYIFSNEINSINDFPIKLFQINNKFRNEIRIKNEILRTNEFIMKDGYSIHYNYLCSNNTYLSLYETYKMIFIKFKIKFFILKINNENNYYSHEFRSLSNIGNKIKFNENNIEYNNTKNIFLNSIEIAHIFKMGNKYSNFFKKKNNINNKKIIINSYGIGILRLLYTIIEHNIDNKGINWPCNIQPFDISIIKIDNSNITKKFSEKIYFILKKNNINVFFNNDNKSFGQTIYNMDYIGVPYSLLINSKNLLKNFIEFKYRKNNLIKLINVNNILKFIKKILNK